MPDRLNILPLLLVSTFFQNQSLAQCTVASSCGYSLSIGIEPLYIIPSSTSCPYGYNYNVAFSYTVKVYGVNTCYNGNLGLQPEIMCNSQNNGYYTINVAAPNVGDATSSSSFSGTLATTTNPYSSATDCASATPASQNCNGLQVTVYGPGISSTTYPCSFSILPIELMNFDAALANNVVTLKWSTASEKNNAFFSLERSTDALNWKQISQLSGAGTSSQMHHYLYKDAAFDKGINYYRLKQTDNNADFKYSSLAVIDASAPGAGINYYPNPFNDILNIETSGDAPKEITIMNAMGQALVNETIQKTTLLDIGYLPGGIYLLKVKEGDQENNFKLIKNRQ